MDSSAGKQNILVKEIQKRFRYGRSLYSSEFNRRASQCVARKMAQTSMVAGVVMKEVETSDGSRESEIM